MIKSFTWATPGSRSRRSPHWARGTPKSGKRLNYMRIANINMGDGFTYGWNEEIRIDTQGKVDINGGKGNNVCENTWCWERDAACAFYKSLSRVYYEFQRPTSILYAFTELYAITIELWKPLISARNRRKTPAKFLGVDVFICGLLNTGSTVTGLWKGFGVIPVSRLILWIAEVTWFKW